MKPDFRKILTDSLRMTIDIATESVDGKLEYFEDVLNLAIGDEAPLNMRASRVIALLVDKYHGLLMPFVDEIANLFPNFNTDGQKRSFAYVLSKYVNRLSEDNQAKMIDVCFDYMLLNEKVAVKYNCMKFLFQMTELYPELSGELQSAIDFNLKKGIFRMNGEIKKIYKTINTPSY